MSELKAHKFLWPSEIRPDAPIGKDYYHKSDVDALLAEKDAEIAELKKKCLDVKDAALVLVVVGLIYSVGGVA